ncbi:hypothetical protein B9T31_00545 [Acinetobacter sp. ANC 4558]|uniref:PH domain-containing protein n=1 Tax=Acinetobacter sp. ANC 4558 TaxID=1977876 RepID=UPI000A35BE50|nr:PH domain-containing protein [Acinetobacter sp. ANC 4558]OTG88050.1 hypothetical protein B9T31_00545 [Acinetobacter sp. ANC 4558]
MQKFHTKIDWWVYAFLICLTGLLIQLLITMQAKGNITAYPFHSITYLLTILVIWWPVANTRYVVDHENLIITCMFLKWKIKLSDIEKIEPTSNSVSSPALSLNRLKIEYTKGGKNKFVLVSPRNKDKFYQALQQNDADIANKLSDASYKFKNI